MIGNSMPTSSKKGFTSGAHCPPSRPAGACGTPQRACRPSPNFLHLDLLEDHPGPFRRFLEHFEQDLADALVDGRFLLGRDMVDAGFGSFACQLYRYERHGIAL